MIPRFPLDQLGILQAALPSPTGKGDPGMEVPNGTETN
jgi:hypothetical protein